MRMPAAVAAQALRRRFVFGHRLREAPVHGPVWLCGLDATSLAKTQPLGISRPANQVASRCRSGHVDRKHKLLIRSIHIVRNHIFRQAHAVARVVGNAGPCDSWKTTDKELFQKRGLSPSALHQILTFAVREGDSPLF
jgi:hypothetical protein